jgi:hypothetical protein
MADTDQKKRDRKRNFTEPEINVIQDEVEKNFSYTSLIPLTL